MINWKLVKHFKPTENWGNVKLIDPELVYDLDAFRAIAGTRIRVNCGTQGTHRENSFHYWKRDPSDENEMPKGLAVDICFPDEPITRLPDLFLLALKFRFQGVGIYPYWKLNGFRIGGLHLDMRPWAYRGTWIGLGNRRYETVTFSALTKYFIKGE